MSGKAADFHAFAAAGRRLVELHVNYEQQKPYPLKHVENPDSPLDWRVEAMKLTSSATPSATTTSSRWPEFRLRRSITGSATARRWNG